MDLEPGMMVRSKAGRDKDCVYVITDVRNGNVYVADGEKKPLRHAKRKNRKHLQPILKARAGNLQDDAALREFLRKNAPEGSGVRAEVQED